MITKYVLINSSDQLEEENANRKVSANLKHNQLYCYGPGLRGIEMLSILQTLNFPNLKYDKAVRSPVMYVFISDGQRSAETLNLEEIDSLPRRGSGI